MMGAPNEAAPAFDFTTLSRRNDGYPRRVVSVANGARFVSLEMPPREMNAAANVLYMHVHKATRRCYIGITVMPARMRWAAGTAYRNQPYFGNAIAKYGWMAFRSHVLAFFDDRGAANEAERNAILAAGGHRSRLNFNASPGGDAVADTAKPVVGVNLVSGEERRFVSGVEAARVLCVGNPDGPMAVARGERVSIGDWWFRFEDDANAQVPDAWGEALRVRRIREVFGKPVLALNLRTREERTYPTAAAAAADLGCDQSSVIQVANGDIASSRDWWFKYVGDAAEPPVLWGAGLTRAKRDVPVYGVNLETKERRKFRNFTVADRELGFSDGSVSAVVSGRRVSVGGWWFSLLSTAQPPELYRGSLVAKIRSKPVIASNASTGESREYPSGKAAAADLGLHESTVSVALRKRRSVGGWKFERP